MFSRWVKVMVDESAIPAVSGSETNLKIEH